MAISAVGTVTLATATSTGWTCTLPAGVQADDVAFTFLCKVAAAAPTLPSGQGYTLLDPADTGASVLYLWCYAAVLQAADAGANHVWAWGSTRAAACCLVLRGVDPAQVLDVADPAAAPTGTNASASTPAATTASAGAWVLRATACAADVTHTFQATDDGNAITRVCGDVAGALGLAWSAYPTAGTATTSNITLSATGRWLGKTIVAKPGAATGDVVQRWDGSAWQTAAVQRWDGSAWQAATVKRWTGTGWV